MTTGWQSIDNALSALGLRFGPPTADQTTGGSHAPNSEHYAGRARDYGDASSDVSAITKALLPYATGPNAPIDELFSSRDGVFMANGERIVPGDALRQDHYDHVHVGVRSGVDLAALIDPTAAAASSSAPTGTLTGLNVNGVGGIATTALFLAAGVGAIIVGAKHGFAGRQAA